MQMSIFDLGCEEFVITKPIRLIELFAGYGSQHLALNYLGVEPESYKICEWAIKSIQAYKDAHFGNDNTDYSKDLTKEQVINYLANKGISSNYNEPMNYEQTKRLGEEKARKIYNNIIATHNLVNIQQVKGLDLEIKDTEQYCYIMTYSFPCQDLSKAGLSKGMEKGSGTRSSMLWEVERILEECNELNSLPQVLVMENVPDVIGTNNIKYFASWLAKVESLGYHCYWQVLNAKDYGVAQNRERCFMVSILGDYYYDFPQSIKLEKRLKDFLEDNVDKKYDLSKKSLNGKLNTNFNCSKLENCLPKDGIVSTLMARDYKDPKCVQVAQLDGKFESTGRVYSENGLCPTINTCSGGNREPKIMENLKTYLCNELIQSGKVLVNINNKRQKQLAENIDTTKDGQFLDFYNQTTNENVSGTITTRVDASNSSGVYNNYRIRKLTPKECFRLMGVKDEDFEKIAKNQSNASLYHLAGDSIVVNVLMAIFGQLYNVDWKPIVYGKWWKTEKQRLLELPLFQIVAD